MCGLGYSCIAYMCACVRVCTCVCSYVLACVYIACIATHFNICVVLIVNKDTIVELIITDTRCHNIYHITIVTPAIQQTTILSQK